jgi:AraC-like DNA-binding protein
MKKTAVIILEILLTWICFAYAEKQPPIFYSSFESTPFLTAESIAAGTEAFSLVPDKEISWWPQKNGRGIIQGFSPEMSDTFVYARRRGNRLTGVKGLRFFHPRFSDIRLGTIKPWTEHSPPIFTTRQGYYGLYAAQVTAPHQTYNAITHYLPEQKDFWVSFYVKYSLEFLNDISQLKEKYHHELKDNSVFQSFIKMGLFYYPRKKQPVMALRLPFFANKTDTLITDTLAVKPEKYYLVEYRYSGLSKQGTLVEFYVNDRFVGRRLALADKNPNTLNRIRFYSDYHGAYWVDEVRVTPDRFGFFPAQPSVPNAVWSAWQDTLHLMVDRRNLSFIESLQWWISSENNWDCEVFNSGEADVDRHPFSLFVGNFRHPGGYFLRVRQKSVYQNWSSWSMPVKFNVILPDSAPLAKDSLVNRINIYEPDKNENLQMINAGQWYDIEVLANPGQWEALTYIDIIMQSHQFILGTTAGVGGPFNKKNNYLIRFNLKAKSLWIKERPKVFSLSEYTDRKGELVNGLPGFFTIDSVNHRLRVRFRILPEGDVGLWYVRTHINYEDTYYKRTVIVTHGVRTRKPYLAYVFLCIFGVIIIIGFVAGYFRRRQSSVDAEKYPEVVKQVNQYVRNNISRPITIKEIADEMSMGQSNLGKIYKKACGKSIKAFIQEERMDIAKKLLVETDKSVSEILFKLGFNDPSYFSYQFKSRFGMTPLDYRKKHRLKSA